MYVTRFFHGIRLPVKEQARMWRAAARGARVNGDTVAYERYARTAAIIERRPWKVDRDQHSR